MAQRDPHDVLGVDRDASQATVKAAWRRLAREHHPDLAPDSAARRDATRRMAEINAAYQVLRSAAAGRAGKPGRDAAAAGGHGPGPHAPDAPRASGPPPPPPTRPVTARLDTTHLFRQRNATTTPAGGGYRHRPRAPVELRRATWGEAEEPRASDPTGPLERVRARRSARRPLPGLEVALAMEIVFGKFHGRTLREIAALEPTYLEWLERTITRDPDLVAAARVVLDECGRHFIADPDPADPDPADPDPADPDPAGGDHVDDSAMSNTGPAGDDPAGDDPAGDDPADGHPPAGGDPADGDPPAASALADRDPAGGDLDDSVAVGRPNDAGGAGRAASPDGAPDGLRAPAAVPGNGSEDADRRPRVEATRGSAG